MTTETKANIEVWIGSIGAYNNGLLIGEWVALPQDIELLDEVIEGINSRAEMATGELQEEIEIFDTDCKVKGLGQAISDMSLQQINEIAETLEELDEADVDNIGVVNDVQGDLIASIEMVEEAIVLDDVSTDQELGETLHANDMLHIEIPDHLENYIDFESVGRDLRLGGEWYINEDESKAVCIP